MKYEVGRFGNDLCVALSDRGERKLLSSPTFCAMRVAPFANRRAV
jgi:hypothetical protein